MNDYLKAIYYRFYVASAEEETLNRQIDELHRNLSARMEKEDRRRLLRMVDLEASLQNCMALNSFIAGVRVASGIYHELMQEPLYSFTADEERRAIEILKKERDTLYENPED